jgi:hypothetical protein
MVLQLAATAQRVHRRSRDAKSFGDLPHGELDPSEAGSECPLDSGTKLQATCCGSVRQVREANVA